MYLDESFLERVSICYNKCIFWYRFLRYYCKCTVYSQSKRIINSHSVPFSGSCPTATLVLMYMYKKDTLSKRRTGQDRSGSC
jgi:hypothetical protein